MKSIFFIKKVGVSLIETDGNSQASALLFNKALSADEIKQLYNCSKSNEDIIKLFAF
tara:strand:+ start:16804 stop:16974 length:171 start_codon:yes stop_codon:yes gene_type:complete